MYVAWCFGGYIGIANFSGCPGLLCRRGHGRQSDRQDGGDQRKDHLATTLLSFIGFMVRFWLYGFVRQRKALFRFVSDYGIYWNLFVFASCGS